MRNNFLYLVMVGAFLGFVFASFSTYDFVRHLDRQVHGVHCSFVPGLSSLDVGSHPSTKARGISSPDEGSCPLVPRRRLVASRPSTRDACRL